MKPLLLICLSSLPFFAGAQQGAVGNTPGYPQDYFRNPLDIPIFLAGNFGECRPGHFHSGVDIKTLGVENQPVHAAADGYISRIKMEPGGFGHGIYITHPNGYTTLYAHLNKFAPAIQKYVEEQQYAKKRWDVDLQFSPTQFPVTKGQQIAWSGNTGASTAPHLHFEIRNTKTEHPLNPELFGLPIIDKTPPLPAEVVVYQQRNSGEFYEDKRLSFPLQKTGGLYELERSSEIFKDVPVNNDTLALVVYGNFGIGINVDDHMEGSDNTIAFYTAQLYMDEQLQAQITLDNIGYDETRYINAYSDYKIKQQQNKWVQCLFKLPGNHLDHIYTYLNTNEGWLHCDTAVHKIEIVITDDKDNQSRIVFYVAHEAADIITEPGGLMQAGYKPIIFQANRSNYYNDSAISFTLDENALYDDLTFAHKTIKYTRAYSDKYRLQEPYVPIHRYFDLSIKPNKPIPSALATKVAMIYSDDKDEDGRATVPADNGWYKAKVRNFGTYWLDIDTIPPVIKSLQKNNSNLSRAQRITFEVKDSMTSVKSFSGYLDGKWICFEQHSNLFFYNFDSHCSKGKHKLVFKAEDENGNEQTYKLNFTR